MCPPKWLSSKLFASQRFASMLSLALNVIPSKKLSLSSLLLMLLSPTSSTLQVLWGRKDECTPARARAKDCWGNGVAPPSLLLVTFSTLHFLTGRKDKCTPSGAGAEA
jgi:hypothetical protein